MKQNLLFDIQSAFKREVFVRALFVALVVGVILNLINQGGKLVHLQFDDINFIKFGLTFIVPYLVSTYSSVMAKRNFIPGETSLTDVHLSCNNCHNNEVNIKKGEIIPICNNCGSHTKWKVSPKSNSEILRMEEEIKSRAMFVELNPAPVLRIDVDGNVLEANSAANKIFNKKPLVGKDALSIISNLKNIDIKDVITNDKIIDFVEEHDDLLLRFELRGVSKLNICHLYGADLSEILSTRKENLKYLAAIEQSYNSIIITDTLGKIEYVNNAFKLQTGYSKDDVLGKNPRILKSGITKKETYKELWDTITSGKVWHGEFNNRKKDGSFYWEHAIISPIIDNEGKIINFLSIKEDITEQRKIKKEMQSMALFAQLNPEPVFRFDKNGIILQSNPAADKAFDRPISNLNIKELLNKVSDINFESFIRNSQITTIIDTIDDKIYRLILRGISELDICQIYGSDITERVKAQEKIIEQKKNITKSIEYASRIQQAVLPSFKKIEESLPEHFIFYLPRDIVSGDFYWMSRKDSRIIIVAADCTGHGVPGAFMSMLGISFLNEIVNKNIVTKASKILNQMRANVKSTLAQSGEHNEPSDGMDMALCIIDLEKNEMQYAGAYNPLYIIRNGELIETKADKMPIGIYPKEKESFTNNVIKFEKGDNMYIFSDGFIDQFGGEKSRKYKSSNFKKLLLDINKEPMNKQYEIIENTFYSWKGDEEQVDDILVIGFKV